MGTNGQPTDTYASRIAPRNGAPAAGRTVEPSWDVQEALADFRDLCFRPPEDPQEPNSGRLGCNSPIAGEALVALEALYDSGRMRQVSASGRFRDGVDVVRHALAAVIHLQKDPDAHLYRPLTPVMPPPRDPCISLATVLFRLSRALHRDFRPEIDTIKRELGLLPSR